MKLPLLLISLYFSWVIEAKDDFINHDMKHNFEVLMREKSEEIKQAELAYSKWNAGLQEYLLNYPDPNVRIFGLRYLTHVTKSLIPVSEQIKLRNNDEISEIISELVIDEKTSPQALIILDSICNQQKQLYNCDKNKLIRRLIEVESDNIISYLRQLHNANVAQNQIDVDIILASMAKAKYSNSHSYMIKEFELAVREYEAQNHFPQSYIDSNKKMYEDFIGFSDSKLQDMYENFEDYMFFGLFVGYKIALPIPNHMVILNACKNPQSSFDHCMLIADKLENNSFSIVGMMVGYSLKTRLLENTKYQKDFLKAKEEENKARNRYKCLTESLYGLNNLDNSFNLDLYELGNRIEREHGEFTSIMKQAELNYQYQISKDNEDAINPKSCFE